MRQTFIFCSKNSPTIISIVATSEEDAWSTLYTLINPLLNDFRLEDISEKYE